MKHRAAPIAVVRTLLLLQKKSAIAVKGTERAGVRSLALQRRDVSELLLVVYCGHLLRRAMRKKDAEGEERKSLRGRGEGGGERGGEYAGLDEGCEASPRARLIAINNSPLLEYTTPCNEIMQIKRKF